MSSGEGTLGVCNACRGYITEEKDLKISQINSLSAKGYEHKLCWNCSQTLSVGWSTINIIHFILSVVKGEVH